MKILVIGGTGMIGGRIACHLQAQGNEVTIVARKPPAAETAMAQMPLLLRDYTKGDFTAADFEGFDALVFAAGHDVRHLPEGADYATYWDKVNSRAIPALFGLARAGGVRRAVLVGSFYPQVMPELIEREPYVRSRHLADEGVRALATDAFAVCSVNAPFVVGTEPGLSVPMFQAYTLYAEGKLDGMPVYGPAGGSNFISTQSLAEAVWGALQRGESGKAYLVGDENLTFADYFATFFRALGSAAEVPSLDHEHPLLPDAAIYTGRGNIVAYEPDAGEAALLDYRRNDIRRTVDAIVAQYRSEAA
ncbi:MAG: NAD(P)-dependent oxidoreductase [Oceanospirillaceae bacterium]|nr:NAD(P)-dependent oxidoreductase [Oceanospirillaceae bacterium]